MSDNKENIHRNRVPRRRMTRSMLRSAKGHEEEREERGGEKNQSGSDAIAVRAAPPRATEASGRRSGWTKRKPRYGRHRGKQGDVKPQRKSIAGSKVFYVANGDGNEDDSWSPSYSSMGPRRKRMRTGRREVCSPAPRPQRADGKVVEDVEWSTSAGCDSAAPSSSALSIPSASATPKAAPLHQPNTRRVPSLAESNWQLRCTDGNLVEDTEANTAARCASAIPSSSSLNHPSASTTPTSSPLHQPIVAIAPALAGSKRQLRCTDRKVMEDEEVKKAAGCDSTMPSSSPQNRPSTSTAPTPAPLHQPSAGRPPSLARSKQQLQRPDEKVVEDVDVNTAVGCTSAAPSSSSQNRSSASTAPTSAPLHQPTCAGRAPSLVGPKRQPRRADINGAQQNVGTQNDENTNPNVVFVSPPQPATSLRHTCQHPEPPHCRGSRDVEPKAMASVKGTLMAWKEDDPLDYASEEKMSELETTLEREKVKSASAHGGDPARILAANIEMARAALPLKKFAVYKKAIASSKRKLKHKSLHSYEQSFFDTKQHAETRLYLPERARFYSEIKQGKERIGEGSFGAVFKARYRSGRSNEEPIAVKVVKCTCNPRTTAFIDHLATVEKEATVWKELHHPHILPLIDKFVWLSIDDCGMRVVQARFATVLREDGDLEKYIEKQGRCQEEEVQRVASQILSALLYMHSKNVVHRDIKADNVMIHFKGGKIFSELADFGMAKMNFTDGANTKGLGSSLYCAPESSRGRYGKAVDIFSYGMTLLVAMVGFRTASNKNDDEWWQNWDEEEAMKLARKHSPDAARVIKGLVQRKPGDRTPLEKLKHDPWVSQVDADYM